MQCMPWNCLQARLAASQALTTRANCLLLHSAHGAPAKLLSPPKLIPGDWDSVWRLRRAREATNCDTAKVTPAALAAEQDDAMSHSTSVRNRFAVR